MVEDVMQYSFRDTPEPVVYFPLVARPPVQPGVISDPAYVVTTRRAETRAGPGRRVRRR